MLSAKKIENWIKPFGMKMEVTEVAPEIPEVEEGVIGEIPDRVFFKASITGSKRSTEVTACEVEFSLPRMDEDGIYEVEDLTCSLVREGLLNLGRCTPGGSVIHSFVDRQRIATKAVSTAFHKAFSDFYSHGQPPTNLQLQLAIDGALKPGNKLVQVVPANVIARADVKSLVYVRPPEEGMDLKHRKFRPDWWKKLDPASTPGSTKVNIAYRLAQGSRIVGGEVIAGDKLFCSTLEQFAVAGSLVPRRMHIIRSAMCSTLPLVKGEYPLVKRSALQGRHLVTAVMNIPSYTGEDAIVVSEDAAEKMTAMRTVVDKVFIQGGEWHAKVKAGDVVNEKTPLMEIVSRESKESWQRRIDELEADGKPSSKLRERGPHKKQVFPRKLPYSAFVDSVTVRETVHMGIQMLCVRVAMSAELSLKDGDKVITRQGVKGVVRVLPAERMPETEEGRKVEMIISPESIVTRRAMAVYWEMMATEYMIKTKEPVEAGHRSPRPTFKQLVDAGYGGKTQLTLKGEPLKEKTFVGYLFIVRLDKIAAEIASTAQEGDFLTGMQTSLNSARMSGQKKDPAKNFCMLARGLERTFIVLTKQNMKGRHALREMMKILEP